MDTSTEGEVLVQGEIVDGPFITKGMRISIPELTLSISDDGKLSTGPIVIHTGLDMCPYWLSIAYNHLLAAEKARDKLLEAKEKGDNDAMGDALQEEFIEGMQSIMASGIAVNAFYAYIRGSVNVSQETIDGWRKNRTARYKQIAEVLRRAFHIEQENSNLLRDILQRNFRLRDDAVHPREGTSEPEVHIEFNQKTDWRYARFCFYNAKDVLDKTLRIVWQLVNKAQVDSSPNVELQKHCEVLRSKTQSVADQWEAKFGSIFEPSQ